MVGFSYSIREDNGDPIAYWSDSSYLRWRLEEGDVIRANWAMGYPDILWVSRDAFLAAFKAEYIPAVRRLAWGFEPEAVEARIANLPVDAVLRVEMWDQS
jgi:hypothetical protein